MNECSGLKGQAEQINCLEAKIFEINTKLQATADYTDDLISTSSSVVSHADTVLTTYLALFTFLVAIIIAIITYWVGKERSKHVEEASAKLLSDLAQNDQIRDDFMKKLVAHPNISENINSAIEKIAKDKSQDKFKSIKSIIDDIGD
jgi:hypothetical protein